MTAVSPEVDARNVRLIRSSLRQCVGLGLSAKQIWLLAEGSPEDRAEYVRKQRNVFLVIAAIVVAYVSISSFLPQPQKPMPPAPELSTAGPIQSLQLHETTFSRSTTVVTGSGTYQVRGGVSASVGDTTMLKKEIQPIQRTSLCVESKIKPHCYDLL